MAKAFFKKYRNVVLPVRVIIYHSIKTVRHFLVMPIEILCILGQ